MNAVLWIVIAAGLVGAVFAVLVVRRRGSVSDDPLTRARQAGSVLSTQLESPRSRQRRKKRDFADKTMGEAGTDSSAYGGTGLGGGCGGGGL
ncbi:hypothetical protein DFR70_11674 [Nocardia tenerifensis]|uniref:Uncharacterized protein n=1 Tax=Nocardia tenerifensis TaxID=228006 RepID=A0A318JS72_9NOCA|nr:hypothetical protein [Nocardia tenerifensis]PXX57844.1 hypothetical protein DFR70_11674 [Nocardia tenerifensis]